MVYVQSQQILLPKQVYIGDSAELRITFNTALSLTKASENGTLSTQVTATGNFMEELSSKDYLIKSVELKPAGVNYYQLSIYFIPWKTGSIQLPPYQLVTEDGKELGIKIDEISIKSLLEENQNGTTTSLQNEMAPLLLPGTSWKLWGILIAVVILLIVIIRSIIKHKEINFYLQNKKLLRKYKKNKKQTLKKLEELAKKSGETGNRKADINAINDKDFAEEIQKIMRNYLEVRFNRPFTKTVSSQIMKEFNEATGNLASDNKTEAAGAIAGIFIRTDYIRFSSTGVFLKDEKISSVQELKKNIEILEAQEVQKEEKPEQEVH